MNLDDKYRNLDRVHFWIENADSKVSYFLALQGIVLTIIFTSSLTKTIVKTLAYEFCFTNISYINIVKFIEALSLYMFLTLISFSFSYIFKALKANINSDLNVKSSLFFGHIANKEFHSFIEDQKMSEFELENEIDSQVYISSKICKLKFESYNLAINFCLFSIIPALIYLLIIVKYGS